MAIKAWILTLILTALPAFAGPEQFNPGDVVVARFPGICDIQHGPPNRFGAELYRRGSAWPVPLKDLGSPRWGPMTHSPALNRMILTTSTMTVLGRSPTLETLDADGNITPLLTLPVTGEVTALAGVGHEILAVVFVIARGQFELWRIAAADGTVIEQIGLPRSLMVVLPSITSIDLAGDGCTLAYAARRNDPLYRYGPNAAPGEPFHRYDICRRQPLTDLSSREASAVHFLPGGDLLAAEPTEWFQWLTRYAPDGRIVTTAVALTGGDWIEEIALDPDGSTAWLATSSRCGNGTVATFSTSSAVPATGPWAFSFGVSIAVAGEWRAAAQPARRRSVR